MLRSNSNQSVPNYGLENFATVSRSCCQHSSTVELVDDTYNRYGRSTHRALVAVTSLHDCNSITSICSGFVEQLCSHGYSCCMLTRFLLTRGVARSVCGTRASCFNHASYARAILYVVQMEQFCLLRVSVGFRVID